MNGLVAFTTRIHAVKNWKTALVLQFDHPHGVRAPSNMTGYALGEYVKPSDVSKLCKAILNAAWAKTVDDLVGRACDVMVDSAGVVLGVVFPDTKLYCYFPDYLPLP